MKLYHILIAGIIATGIIVSFTQFGVAGDGLLHNLRYNANGSTSYNSNINLTKFSAYNQQDAFKDDISTLEGNLNNSGVGDEDTEQNIYLKFSGAIRDLTNSFTTSYQLMGQAQKDLGLPAIIFTTLSMLLALFIIVRGVGGWFFNR